MIPETIWLIDRLIPYVRNPRKNDEAVDRMVASIKEFGFKIPILVRSTGEVIDGHLRIKAARKLGMAEVPVILCDEWTEAQVKAFRLLVNRSVSWAQWDEELVALEMVDLQKLEYDLALTGFDAPEVKEFLQSQAIYNEAAEEEIPEAPETPTSMLGDLWLLGEHRVLCGDSTSVDAVARLMDGQKAGLMNTDPPYGISYDSADVHEHGVSYAKIDNDQREDAELQEFLEKVFAAALTALNPNAAWYLWHAMLTQGFFAAAAAAAAAHVILHRQIIWVKPVLVFGHGQYHWKHELCFMGWVKGHMPPDYGAGNGERNQTTVWEIDGITQAERNEFKHSTPKPVALFDIPIRKHLKAGEICFEPFAGSGPQIIAAEKAGVRCFALELEPQHVDVIVKRWQAFTGKQARHDQTGLTFDELAADRLGTTDRIPTEHPEIATVR